MSFSSPINESTFFTLLQSSSSFVYLSAYGCIFCFIIIYKEIHFFQDFTNFRDIFVSYHTYTVDIICICHFWWHVFLCISMFFNFSQSCFQVHDEYYWTQTISLWCYEISKERHFSVAPLTLIDMLVSLKRNLTVLILSSSRMSWSIKIRSGHTLYHMTALQCGHILYHMTALQWGHTL